MNRSYRGLFDDWEVGVATKIITKFRNRWKCLRLQDFEDLLQECLTHWYFAKDEYDSSVGANQRTFMAKVIKHKLQHKIEELTSDKRKVYTEVVSLDEYISEEEDSPTYADQLPADEDYTYNLRRRIDILKVLQKLTPRQQEICRLLGEEGLNIQEASKVLEIPRTTFYEEIKRIRLIFEKEGLHEYLK